MDDPRDEIDFTDISPKDPWYVTDDRPAVRSKAIEQLVIREKLP